MSEPAEVQDVDDLVPYEEFSDEAKLNQIQDLYLRNVAIGDIAVQTSLTRPAVTLAIKVLRDQWRRKRVRQLDAKLDEELAKIDKLELEYWVAWERSKVEKQKKTSGVRRNQNTQTVIATTRTEQSDGNPAFLLGVQWCIDQRCKILGYYSPSVNIIQQQKDGAPITDEERAIRLASLLERARDIQAKRQLQPIVEIECQNQSSPTTTPS